MVSTSTACMPRCVVWATQRYARPIRDGALSEIAQHVGVQQDIRPTAIGHDKAEPFPRVEPLHVTVQGFPVGHILIFRHSVTC